MKKKSTKSEKESKIWREGYENGVKTLFNQKNKAIQIGEAILAVLDERYEFKAEDY